MIVPEMEKSVGKGMVSLARALSKLGFASRKNANEIILSGKVSVNNKIKTNPNLWIDINKDSISVDGNKIKSVDKIYVVLNKPRGLITTTSDEQGRETVYECLKDKYNVKLFPVGRLDKASEGLIFFTNDTQWGEKITNPKTHLTKVYCVQIDRILGDDELQKLLSGIEVDDEIKMKCADVKIIKRGQKNCWLEIKLTEGKNRQIRKMLNALDIEVIRLIRIAIGPIELGELKKGESRYLTKNELAQLQLFLK